jgi:hypothetical protein
MKIDAILNSYTSQVMPTTEIKPVVGLALDGQAKKDLVESSIRFEVRKDGQTVVHFKDENGQEKQIPTKVAIEQSERIQKILTRLEDDLYPNPFRRIDLRA